VKHSPWKDGKGDVVRELSDACREAGMKFGLYCSPLDLSQPSYTQDKAAYSRLYRQQLTELLSNYGEVYEMWFDGNRADINEWPEVINLVRRLQPKAVIKQGPRVQPITEDVRWVGNEQAVAPLTCWSPYPAPEGNVGAQAIWFPVESDIPMVGSWFWNDKPPKPLDQLLDIYYKSVGRNSILLLNVAPDRRGHFSDESIARLHGFRASLEKIFKNDLATGKRVKASNVRGNEAAFAAENVVDGNPKTYWATDDNTTQASLEIDLGAETEFNVIRLEEMIELGQRVKEYRVETWSAPTELWSEVAHGTTIGYRKLDRFPKVMASRIRVTIVGALAAPAIRSVGAYLDTVSPADSFRPENALAEVKPKHK
jgi:alpha-L-fucosidase